MWIPKGSYKGQVSKHSVALEATETQMDSSFATACGTAMRSRIGLSSRQSMCGSLARTRHRRAHTNIFRRRQRAYFLWEGLNLLEERDSTGLLKARYTH